MTDNTKKPGDLILERYMPGATAEEREAARQNLLQFAATVIGIAKRRAHDEDDEIRAKHDQAIQ